MTFFRSNVGIATNVQAYLLCLFKMQSECTAESKCNFSKARWFWSIIRFAGGSLWKWWASASHVSQCELQQVFLIRLSFSPTHLLSLLVGGRRNPQEAGFGPAAYGGSSRSSWGRNLILATFVSCTDLWTCAHAELSFHVQILDVLGRPLGVQLFVSPIVQID